MSALRYCLMVRREISVTEGYHSPEYPDLPSVSEAAFDLLAHRTHYAEPPIATWNGGDSADNDVSIGRALISGQPELRATVDELLPLLRWCRVHTRLTDVCELEAAS